MIRTTYYIIYLDLLNKKQFTLQSFEKSLNIILQYWITITQEFSQLKILRLKFLFAYNIFNLLFTRLLYFSTVCYSFFFSCLKWKMIEKI